MGGGGGGGDGGGGEGGRRGGAKWNGALFSFDPSLYKISNPAKADIIYFVSMLFLWVIKICYTKYGFQIDALGA